jgi:hypothetical protein
VTTVRTERSGVWVLAGAKKFFSFPKLPGPLWGPPRLLLKGIAVSFSGRKQLTTHLHLLTRVRMCGVQRLHPFNLSLHGVDRNIFSFFYFHTCPRPQIVFFSKVLRIPYAFLSLVILHALPISLSLFRHTNNFYVNSTK